VQHTVSAGQSNRFTHTIVAVAGIGVGIPPCPTDAIAAGTEAPRHWLSAFTSVTATEAEVIPGTPNTVTIWPPSAAVRHSVAPFGRNNKGA
jgi:hypothetical protein